MTNAHALAVPCLNIALSQLCPAGCRNFALLLLLQLIACRNIVPCPGSSVPCLTSTLLQNNRDFHTSTGLFGLGPNVFEQSIVGAPGAVPLGQPSGYDCGMQYSWWVGAFSMPCCQAGRGWRGGWR